MKNIIQYIIVVTTCLGIGVNVSAKEQDLPGMIAEIKIAQATEKRRNEGVYAGKQRALLCAQCHGEDGNSSKPDIPNLASQNPVYLLKQISKFADGSRKNYVMNALSKNFTRDDKINLALYYANMKIKTVRADKKLAAKGQPLYKSRCSACHGDKGIGKADFARIAGQQVLYVKNTLKRFRDNSKNTTTTTSSKRNNVIMESIAKNLTDDDINVLAAYLAQL